MVGVELPEFVGARTIEHRRHMRGRGRPIAARHDLDD